MSRLQAAVEHIVFARSYTSRLLEHVDPADWFRMPSEGVTHIAWQVGHLAMAEYRLALERLRGARPEDANLISDRFLFHFGRDSIAVPGADQNPPPSEIREVFDRVHQQALRELEACAESELEAPPLKAHQLAKTKLDCLYWCSHHEMLHAGQIGLLRRLLGAKPIW